VYSVLVGRQRKKIMWRCSALQVPGLKAAAVAGAGVPVAAAVAPVAAAGQDSKQSS